MNLSTKTEKLSGLEIKDLLKDLFSMIRKLSVLLSFLARAIHGSRHDKIYTDDLYGQLPLP